MNVIAHPDTVVKIVKLILVHRVLPIHAKTMVAVMKIIVVTINVIAGQALLDHIVKQKLAFIHYVSIHLV